MADIDLDIVNTAQDWLAEDGAVALATVIKTWGSAPVPVGGQMVVRADGRFQGSCSGGCVEGDVIVESEDVLESGKPQTLDFGVDDDTAWRAGLPCGGQIKVFVERLQRDAGDADLLAQISEGRSQRRAMVIKKRLDNGSRELFVEGATIEGPLADEIAGTFFSGASRIVASPDGEVFLHALVPSPRIIIVGATHIGQVLVELAALSGLEVRVVDPRTAFATKERFPNVDLITEWPGEALADIGLDQHTAVVTLAHEAHIDDEALKPALKAGCFYVGALGSRRNHERRRERLLADDISDAEFERIHGPIGLNISAQTPPEIAISIIAEIISALHAPRNMGQNQA